MGGVERDEAEFADKTGHPLYWDAARAREIRAEGQRLAAFADARAFPFDGTWCDVRPNPSWTLPEEFPVGCDRPRAV